MAEQDSASYHRSARGRGWGEDRSGEVGVCSGRGGGGVAASLVSRNKRTVNICPCTSLTC